MNISLKAGLVLRSGQRTLELTRVLGAHQVQFEDTLTRRATTLSTTKVLKRIWEGNYTVVLGNAEVSAHTHFSETDVATKPTELPVLVDLSKLKESWEAQIDYRLRYLKALQAGHVTRGDRSGVARVIKAAAKATDDASPPSASAVMDWARRYQNSDCNPLSLVDRIKTMPRKRRLSDIVEAIISSNLRTQYFTRARHSLTHVHDCIRRDLKLAVRNGEVPQEDAKVGFATVCRRAGEVDVYHRIASREGEARARMVCRSTIDGGGAAYPLQRVEVDHTPLNWVVISDETGLPLGRPLLTVAIDAHSSYILGMYLSFYGAGVTSVVGVLKSSLMPKAELTSNLGLENPWLSHGLADEWVLDNGLEFHSRAFKGISLELGIDMTYCRVRTPWLKPHVERFFSELNYLTLVKGRVHKKVASAMDLDPYKDASISFGNLVKGLTMFVVDTHPFQVNERKLARPFDLFQDGLERCPPAIYPGSWDRVRLVSGLSKPLTVGQGGVELRGIPYGSADLLPLLRKFGQSFKTACKWDPDDLGILFVQNPARLTEWIQCPSRWAEYTEGLSWNQHLMIRKFARQELKDKDSEEKLWAARMRLHDHWMYACRPKDRKNSLKAAQYAGLTSSRITSAQLAPVAPASDPVVLSPPPGIEHEIPEFDAFDMESR